MFVTLKISVRIWHFKSLCKNCYLSISSLLFIRLFCRWYTLNSTVLRWKIHSLEKNSDKNMYYSKDTYYNFCTYWESTTSLFVIGNIRNVVLLTYVSAATKKFFATRASARSSTPFRWCWWRTWWTTCLRWSTWSTTSPQRPQNQPPSDSKSADHSKP